MKRRVFVKKAVASSAVFSIVPSFVLGKGHIPPSDTLYVSAFGVGGRGSSVMNGLDRTNKVKYVTLCDVDDRQAVKSKENFPTAKYYKDFRVMLDKEAKHIDAVSVSTADHTHAVAAMAAEASADD